MEIVIKGKNKALARKEVRYAVEYFSKVLMRERLYQNLSIEVNFIEDHIKSHGSVMWLDSNIRPKEFNIEINSKLVKRRQLIALAHEMVHVKQMASSEMQDYIGRKKYRSFVKWQKKDYNLDMFYWNRPWEIEAYGREDGLYEMYKYDMAILKRNK